MPSNSITVVVTGVKRIDRRLRLLPLKVQKKVLRKAMRDGLKVVQSEVKAEVPVDKGITKRNVVVRAVARRKRGVVELEVRVNPNAQTKKTSKAGKTTFYPAVVQF